MLTLRNRVSALLADPIQAVVRDFNRDFSASDEGYDANWRNAAPISLWEDSGTAYLAMDVPGVLLSNLDITFEQGKLTIKGERTPAAGTPEVMHQERFFGRFERTVVLNECIDPSTIEATLADGVLQLKMAKKPEAQAQRIAINNATGDHHTTRIESAA